LQCLRNGAIETAHLLPLLQTDPVVPPTDSLEDHRSSAEAAAIQTALNAAGGNRSAAARALGISRATLHKKIRQYGIG